MAAAPTPDVCLLLEGTYPYVLGGVSAWVDQIIRGLPEVSFGVCFIGGQRESAQKRAYQLAPNVVAYKEIFLHERLPWIELVPANPALPLRKRLYQQLDAFYRAKGEGSQQFWELLAVLREARDSFTFGNLCHDPESWDLLRRVYDLYAPDESFIDFFWTVRFLHLPLWQIWRHVPEVPPARSYHSISTGYAGLLGAMLARERAAPYLLTEHGIYTKERMVEISNAEWIYEAQDEWTRFSAGLGKLKQLWMGKFRLLGQLTYDTVDRIVTLFEGNAFTQIEFGADQRKITVIPNGIDTGKFDHIRATVRARWQPAPATKTVGFIGRVVPIKDVKTLLRAARQVLEASADTQFLIVGPYAEDPDYFEECRKIVKLLNLEAKVHFLGPRKLLEVLPQLDVLVLTSISEGLPLVILEAFAAGIPVVATDVGACRELVFGRTPQDKALGMAGRLTKILSPQQTAAALLAVLGNPELWRRLSEAGERRAAGFYGMHQMLDAYRELYRGLTTGAAAEPARVAA